MPRRFLPQKTMAFFMGTVMKMIFTVAEAEGDEDEDEDGDGDGDGDGAARATTAAVVRSAAARMRWVRFILRLPRGRRSCRSRRPWLRGCRARAAAGRGSARRASARSRG